jgi:hypothetical protein
MAWVCLGVAGWGASLPKSPEPFARSEPDATAMSALRSNAAARWRALTMAPDAVVRHHLELARRAWEQGDHALCLTHTLWVLRLDARNPAARQLRAQVHSEHRYPPRQLYEDLLQVHSRVSRPIAAPVVGPVALPTLTPPGHPADLRDAAGPEVRP